MCTKKNYPSLAVILITGFLLVFIFFVVFQTPGLAITIEEQSSYLPLISKPEYTPTPSPTPTQTSIPTNTPTPTQNPGEDWLSYINYLRSMGGLHSLSSDAIWSEGCRLHSRYMVKNDEIGHSEDPSNIWYTAAGDEAAGYSNVMVSSSVSSTDMYAIDLWMSGPFHGIAVLDPQLEIAGFGSYREAIGTWNMGASLDVSRGRTSAEPPAGTYPVMWPGNGLSTSILTYRGTEWPDPLTSCPGITADYWNPSGPPIYLQIGSGDITPNVSATSLRQGSSDLEHCEFDETNYSNPNSSAQNTGRWILNTRDAIIIMPKDPLEAGKTYSVSITTNGNNYNWSFTAESSLQLIREQTDTFMRSR